MGAKIIPPPGQNQADFLVLLVEQNEDTALPGTAGRCRRANSPARHRSHFHLGGQGIKIIQLKGLLDISNGKHQEKYTT
jgi:hypothetical protein